MYAIHVCGSQWTTFRAQVLHPPKAFRSLVLGAGEKTEIHGTGFHLNIDKSDSLYLHLKHFFILMAAHVFKLKTSFCSPFSIPSKIKAKINRTLTLAHTSSPSCSPWWFKSCLFFIFQSSAMWMMMLRSFASSLWPYLCKYFLSFAVAWETFNLDFFL